MSKIVSFSAANVMRLTAVEINPTGDVVELVGENGSGKSSILYSIMAVFAGLKSAMPEMCRRDSNGGFVHIELDNGVKADLRFPKSGSPKLVVTDPAGVPVNAPLSYLKAMGGLQIADDPLEKARELGTAEGNRKFFDFLVPLSGLDFDFNANDSKKAAIEADRLQLNRRLKERQGELSALPMVAIDTPTEEIQLSDLLKQIESAEYHNSKHGELIRGVDEANSNIDFCRREIEKVDAEIADLENRIRQHRDERAKTVEIQSQWQAELESRKAAAESFEFMDVALLRQSANESEQLNRNIRIKQRRIAIHNEINTLESDIDAKTKAIRQCEQDALDALASAKFPVDGLSIDAVNRMVCYNGIPLQQASDAQKLIVTISMMMEVNRDLKAILIKDGSLIGTELRRTLFGLVEKYGFQVWMEIVPQEGQKLRKGAFEIVDGTAKEVTE